jgi:hypothetical protein|tara:strand:+ start:271 stop:489 length:219 start_codon:yes stop_codon:yes gene_type:complete
MVVTQLSGKPSEDTLIDALRGCQNVQDLKELEQRLAQVEDAPPLFDWICDLLVNRRLSRGLAAKLLRQLHQP